MKDVCVLNTVFFSLKYKARGIDFKIPYTIEFVLKKISLLISFQMISEVKATLKHVTISGIICQHVLT